MSLQICAGKGAMLINFVTFKYQYKLDIMSLIFT